MKNTLKSNYYHYIKHPYKKVETNNYKILLYSHNAYYCKKS